MKRSLTELERFNRTFEVHSTDRYVASALVDQRMMAWLERSLHRTAIEVADGWAVTWSTSLRGSPRSPQELIDLLIGFSDHIPRAISSLFPRANVERMWVHKKERRGFYTLVSRLSDPAQTTR